MLHAPSRKDVNQRLVIFLTSLLPSSWALLTSEQRHSLPRCSPLLSHSDHHSYHCLHFIAGETGVQRGQRTDPRSHSQSGEGRCGLRNLLWNPCQAVLAGAEASPWVCTRRRVHLHSLRAHLCLWLCMSGVSGRSGVCLCRCGCVKPCGGVLGVKRVCECGLGADTRVHAGTPPPAQMSWLRA